MGAKACGAGRGVRSEMRNQAQCPDGVEEGWGFALGMVRGGHPRGASE